jgi:hypothetical protein
MDAAAREQFTPARKVVHASRLGRKAAKASKTLAAQEAEQAMPLGLAAGGEWP